jgi:hypothetical protein
MRPALRPAPGKRPLLPVRQDNPPDDWLCTWSYRLAVWSPGPRDGVWELKFIHAACHAHARLPAV